MWTEKSLKISFLHIISHFLNPQFNEVIYYLGFKMGRKDLSISQEPINEFYSSWKNSELSAPKQNTIQLKTFLNKAGFISDTKHY
jgi:hypothetical protein